ncbi:MAG: hypothetical protein Tsb0014_47550 [Pleurocapsa sp.]
MQGSMGCIVMSSDRFTAFEKIMARFRDAEIFNLPLFVQLSWSLTRLKTKGLIKSRYEKNLNPYKPRVKYYRSGDSAYYDFVSP